MIKTEVMELLKENQNERGIEHWRKTRNPDKLKSYGIGLTQLRKLAKTVGRDHKLAKTLWKFKNRTPVGDAMGADSVAPRGR